MKIVEVAVGVIKQGNKIYISKRADDLHQGGKWEFPGGKVEVGETAESALARELFEEIGISINACEPFMQIEHDYPDKQVFLDIWQVNSFAGTAHGKEGQDCCWVSLETLVTEKSERLFDFPAANQPVLDRLAKVGI